jgi:hypothetical protein
MGVSLFQEEKTTINKNNTNKKTYAHYLCVSFVGHFVLTYPASGSFINILIAYFLFIGRLMSMTWPELLFD